MHQDVRNELVAKIGTLMVSHSEAVAANKQLAAIVDQQAAEIQRLNLEIETLKAAAAQPALPLNGDEAAPQVH